MAMGNGPRFCQIGTESSVQGGKVRQLKAGVAREERKRMRSGQGGSASLNQKEWIPMNIISGLQPESVEVEKLESSPKWSPRGHFCVCKTILQLAFFPSCSLQHTHTHIHTHAPS